MSNVYSSNRKILLIINYDICSELFNIEQNGQIIIRKAHVFFRPFLLVLKNQRFIFRPQKLVSASFFHMFPLAFLLDLVRNHSRRTGYCEKSPGGCHGPFWWFFWYHGFIKLSQKNRRTIIVKNQLFLLNMRTKYTKNEIWLIFDIFRKKCVYLELYKRSEVYDSVLYWEPSP